MAIATFAHEASSVESVHAVGASSGVRSSVFRPTGTALWVSRSDLDTDDALRWTTDHDDESIHVLEGRVRIGDAALDAGESALVESGMVEQAIALTPATVVQFGASPREARSSARDT